MAETEHAERRRGSNVIKWTWVGPTIAIAFVGLLGRSWLKQIDERAKDHTDLAVVLMQVDSLKQDNESLKNETRDVKGQVQRLTDTVNENARKNEVRWEWLERAIPDRRTPVFGR